MVRPNRPRPRVRVPEGLDLRRTGGERRRVRVGEKIQIDHQDSFHTKYKKPHFMSEAEFTEFRERNPGVVKLLMENPGCEEQIFKQFKAEETRAELRADIRKKIQEHFEASVPWPNGWAYDQSIMQQQEHLEHLLKNKERRRGLHFIDLAMRKMQRRKDIRRLRHSIPMTKGLRESFHQIADHSEVRLRAVFSRLQAEMELDKTGLSIKKLQYYYIPELNAAIQEYSDMRQFIGSAINGKNWMKANARQNKGFGIALSPMSQMALSARSIAGAKKLIERMAGQHEGKRRQLTNRWQTLKVETMEREERADRMVERIASEVDDRTPAQQPS